MRGRSKWERAAGKSERTADESEWTADESEWTADRWQSVAKGWQSLAALVLFSLVLPLIQMAGIARAQAPGAAPSGVPPSPKAASSGLTIILANPSGDRDALYSCDVTFSEPMVPLGTRGKSAGKGPIRFDPPLVGSFTWVGTTTVSFLLRTPPPDGTRIVCTVPKGTKSLSGHPLAADYTWTINYRRPRLLRAIPAIPDTSRPGRAARVKLRGVHPPDDPILLAFDRAPDPKAAARIALAGPGGPIPLHSVPVLPEYIEALNPRGSDPEVPAEWTLALRPPDPLLAATEYTLRVPDDLAFPGSNLGLAGAIRYRFRTLDPPDVTGIEALDDGIVVRTTSEVDPDSLVAHTRITPPAGPLTARDPGSQGTPAITIRGHFAPGKRYLVEITPGLTDRFGRALATGFRDSVVMPHAYAVLEIEPESGILMPGPQENVRVVAQNMKSARLRAVWILDAEMPLVLQEQELETPEGGWPTRPWDSRWEVFSAWPELDQHPDSLFYWQRLLTELGKPPADAHALLFEASGLPLFPEGERTEQGRPKEIVARSFIQIATIGIHCRMGSERGLLWVTDLVTGKPVAGASVAIWDYPDAQGHVPKAALWKGRTDADGLAWSTGRRSFDRNGELLVRAETKDAQTWLPFPKNWDPDLDTPQDPNAAYLFTDRPIYRPGDTVHWKAFVRRSDATGLRAASLRALELVWSAPDGTQGTLQATAGEQGNADGEILLPAAGPTGAYQIALRRPGQAEYRSLGQTAIQVEAYRAPRFEARVEASPQRVLSGSTARFNGRFAYFSGPPLAGLALRWVLYREPAYWSPEGWPAFSFQDQPPGGGWTHEAWRGPEQVSQGDVALDKDGRFLLEVPLALPPELGDATYTFEAGARDLTDQSAFARDRVQVLRGPLRPGVQALWSDDEKPGVGMWDWTVVDTAGRAQPGTPATIELISREWKTVRLRRVGGTFEYENTARDSVLKTLEATSPDSSQRVVVSIPKAGYYLVRVKVREPDGTTLAAAAGRYFSGEEAGSFPRSNVQWIDLQVDRTKANPSDTVHVIVPVPPGGAEALMVLESGGILAASHTRLEGTPRVSLALHHAAPPDLQISAVLVGPDRVPMKELKTARQDYPYSARGNTSVEISQDPWRARVEVTPARTVAAPGESLQVEVRLFGPDGKARAGEVALAVVDEAVLALVQEPDPDPLRGLFPYRGSGTQVEDTRAFLRLSLPLGEKGRKSPGGGGAEGGGARLRTLFRATAYWNPSIPVGSDGIGRVTFLLPDELTRYRIRATAACAGESFGNGDAHVQVNKPLMIEPAVPRFVRAGDQWTLGAVVQNRTNDPLVVTAHCTIEGGRLNGPGEWKGTIPPGAANRVDFPVTVAVAGTITYTLRAEAEGPSGKVEDGLQRTVEASLPTDRITEVAFGRAAPAAEEALRLDDPGIRDAGGLTAQVAPSILGGLGDAARYLSNFPHPCLEQIDSRALGYLARLQLADRLPPDSLSREELEKRIGDAVAEIEGRLTTQGFSLWPNRGVASRGGANGGDEGMGYGGYPYLDGYTLWVLSSIRAADLPVPDRLYSEALRFVRDHLAEEPADAGPDGRGTMRETPPGDDAGPPPSRSRFFTRTDPDTRAFLTWILMEAEGPEAVQESDLERAFMNRAPLGSAGLLCVSLAWDALAHSRPKDVSLQRMVRTRIGGMLESALIGADQTAQFLAVHEAHPGWGMPWNSDSGDRVRATSLAVLLLARHDPDHALLPALVSWLLEQRRHGRWQNTHENAFALQALRDYASKVERLMLPVEARLSIGLMEPKRMQFTKGKLEPVSFSFALPDLQKIPRPDPKRPEVPLRVEVMGTGRVYYQLRMDRSRPALGLPAQEEGIIVGREYVSAADGTRLTRLRRGEPTLVHLTLVVPHDSEFLVLEDPLPAGVEAVNLRLRTSGRSQFAAALDRGSPFRAVSDQGEGFPGSRPGTVLYFTHRDLLDDRARFYADEVPAGVYHVYYPVTPTTRGEFGTPGARAELLYSPEIYGNSEAEVVKVE